MHPDLLSQFASERLKDDHAGVRPEPDGTATIAPQAITIRPRHDADGPAVERLAALEERPVPSGPLLLADIEGTIEAALALETGEAIANPFCPSAEIVSLLELRAEQLRAA